MKVIAAICVVALYFCCCQICPRVQGQNHMPGGISDADINEDGVQEAGEAAADHFNKMSNSLFHRRLGKILSAKKQVVAGANYYIDFLFADTTCMKNQVDHEMVTAENCPFNTATGKVERCNAKVWVKSWLNFTQVTPSGCQPSSFAELGVKK